MACYGAQTSGSVRMLAGLWARGPLRGAHWLPAGFRGCSKPLPREAGERARERGQRETELPCRRVHAPAVLCGCSVDACEQGRVWVPQGKKKRCRGQCGGAVECKHLLPRHIVPLWMRLTGAAPPRALHRICHLRLHQHRAACKPFARRHLFEVALQQIAQARCVAVRGLPLLHPHLQTPVRTYAERGDGLCRPRAGTQCRGQPD